VVICLGRGANDLHYVPADAIATIDVKKYFLMARFYFLTSFYFTTFLFFKKRWENDTDIYYKTTN